MSALPPVPDQAAAPKPAAAAPMTEGTPPTPAAAPTPPAAVSAASPAPAPRRPPPLILGSGARHSVELGGGQGSVATRRVNPRAAVPEGEAAAPPFAPLAVSPMPAAEAAAARLFEGLPEPLSPRVPGQPALPPAIATVVPQAPETPPPAPPLPLPAADEPPPRAVVLEADAATADAPPPARDDFARRLQALRETTRQRRAALERLQRR